MEQMVAWWLKLKFVETAPHVNSKWPVWTIGTFQARTALKKTCAWNSTTLLLHTCRVSDVMVRLNQDLRGVESRQDWTNSL